MTASAREDTKSGPGEAGAPPLVIDASDVAGPLIPLGRRVELDGRGTTFVRELPGPEGAPTVLLLHGLMLFLASGMEITVGGWTSTFFNEELGLAPERAIGVLSLYWLGMMLARLCQRAENEHVGVRCGIMDQFAASLGERDRAMFLDCRDLTYRSVTLPGPDVVLVVCDTNAPRRLGDSEYNLRRAECDAAVATIAEQEPGVESLRDVDPEMLARHAPRLAPVELARAEHVVHGHHGAQHIGHHVRLVRVQHDHVGRPFRFLPVVDAQIPAPVLADHDPQPGTLTGGEHV